MMTKGKGFLILMWVFAAAGGTMMLLSPREERKVQLTSEQRTALTPVQPVAQPAAQAVPAAAPLEPDEGAPVFEDGEGS